MAFSSASPVDRAGSADTAVFAIDEQDWSAKTMRANADLEEGKTSLSALALHADAQANQNYMATLAEDVRSIADHLTM